MLFRSVTQSGLIIMKCAMMVLPLVCIVIGFLIYLKTYKIDRAMYQEILKTIAERENNKEGV